MIQEKMHLLPGLSQQKFKNRKNESLKVRCRAPRSIILIFIPLLFVRNNFLMVNENK
jgi:hypothetical protein